MSQSQVRGRYKINSFAAVAFSTSLRADKAAPTLLINSSLRVYTVLLLVALAATAMASTDVEKVAKANTAFTNKIFEQLTKKEGNVFFSPLSMHAVLSMAYQGSSGETKKDFERVLGVDARTAAAGYNGLMNSLNNVQNVTLALANKIYLKNGYEMNPSFKKSVTGEMLSEVENINFSENEAAAANINGWCRKKTNNKIDELIKASDLDDDTRLVLLNAIYFKGNWLHQFSGHSTSKRDFYVTPEKTVKVDMMYTSKKFNYGDNSELGAQVLQMKYSNEDISMVILLPHEKDGIKKLEQKLINYDLSTITNDLHEMTVDVHLPKFKVETEMDLKETFEAVGLQHLFKDADFRAMLTSPEPLVVSKAIQKAFIEVNEEGSEAAAVTGFSTLYHSARRQPRVIANHPFMVLIILRVREEINVLFYGKIMKPEYL